MQIACRTCVDTAHRFTAVLEDLQMLADLCSVINCKSRFTVCCVEHACPFISTSAQMSLSVM